MDFFCKQLLRKLKYILIFWSIFTYIMQSKDNDFGPTQKLLYHNFPLFKFTPLLMVYIFDAAKQ